MVSRLPKTKELENMGKAIEEIGAAKVRMRENIIKDVRNVLAEKGYDAALVYAEQTMAEDENVELVRVLAICRKYGLSPEIAAQVLDKLCMIETGKW